MAALVILSFLAGLMIGLAVVSHSNTRACASVATIALFFVLLVYPMASRHKKEHWFVTCIVLGVAAGTATRLIPSKRNDIKTGG